MDLSMTRSRSPLNLATSATSTSVSAACNTTTALCSTTTATDRSSDEIVSSSTATILSNESERLKQHLRSIFPLYIHTNGAQSEQISPSSLRKVPSLLTIHSDARISECTSKDSVIHSESFPVAGSSSGIYFAPIVTPPAETKSPVVLPTSLKEKMDRYETKMRYVRESIRVKRLQQGLTCHQCGRSYCRPYNLKRHIQYECGKAPQFPCLYCSYRARHKHDLKKHVTFKHGNYIDHFQAVQDQLDKKDQQKDEGNLLGIKQKIRDKVILRQLQSGGGFSDDGLYGAENLLKNGVNQLQTRPKQSKREKRSWCPSAVDLRANADQMSFAAIRSQFNSASESSSGNAVDSTDRSESKVRTSDINTDSCDPERERDSGIHSTETSPDARIERDNIQDLSHTQGSFNGDGQDNGGPSQGLSHKRNGGSKEDVRVETDEESSDELTIDEEHSFFERDSHRDDQVSTNQRDGQVSASLRDTFLSTFNPMSYNPYLPAFGTQMNNNDLMNKILLENPLLFQQNLKHALMFMNQYNPALAGGFPV